MGWFDKLIGKPEPVPMVAEAAPVDPARLITEPRDGIHHEIFPDDEPVNGRYRWMARTYDKDGTPHQMTGSEESPEASVQAAIAWSESKKAELRGKA